jgi:glycosyltransferase involved in cell wall biosynthesis
MQCLHVLAGRDIGGGERIALQMYDTVARATKFDAALAAPVGGTTEKHLLERGLKFNGFNEQRLFRKSIPTSLIEGWHAIGRPLLRRERILHIHSPFVYGALRRVAAASGARTIVHVHLEYPKDSLAWAFGRPPDAIFVCAAYLKNQVIDALPAQRRSVTTVTVLPNAVDLTRFSPGSRRAARQKIGLPQEGAVISMVANLAPHKGQLTALHALATLHHTGVKARLMLIGECRDTASDFPLILRDLIQKLGVQPYVSVLGARDDVPDLLRASDFLLLPSTNEGLPLSILEAQACGAIVLAAPTAGIPEIVQDAVTGYLIAANDADAYAKRISSLLQDSHLSESIRTRAMESVTKGFGIESYKSRLLAAYADLANSRPAAPSPD